MMYVNFFLPAGIMEMFGLALCKQTKSYLNKMINYLNRVSIVIYVKLLRPKDWIKNLFIFIPLFFAGELFDLEKLLSLTMAMLTFSCIAGAIYIINDCKDAPDDRRHPEKRNRPIASGKASQIKAIALSIFLVILGFSLGLLLNFDFFLILSSYFAINLGYTLGWKRIPILDILILSIGFVLRIRAGSVVGNVFLSEWIIIMFFLLALFLAIGKRRDDMVLQISSGAVIRRSLKGYTLELLNFLMAIVHLFCPKYGG